MPALDTHSVGLSGLGNAFTLPNLSTDTLNEVLFVVSVAQSGTGAGGDGGTAQVSSITDSASLAWQKRSGIFNLDALVDLEVWYAPTPVKLVNNSINVFLNRNSRASFLAFAVTGFADINDPFDADPSNPSAVGYPNVNGASPPLSTKQARTLLFLAGAFFGNGAGPTASSPFAVNFIQNGTYVTAFVATNQRTAQANNVQSVVAGGTGSIEDLSIIGDACKGPGWLRYDFFVGGG